MSWSTFLVSIDKSSEWRFCCFGVSVALRPRTQNAHVKFILCLSNFSTSVSSNFAQTLCHHKSHSPHCNQLQVLAELRGGNSSEHLQHTLDSSSFFEKEEASPFFGDTQRDLVAEDFLEPFSVVVKSS